MHTVPQQTRGATSKAIFRFLAAGFFIAAGVNHFIMPRTYRRIIPPSFPARAALVAVSGFFEIAGGVGLLSRRLRPAAGWGLLALLIAVFPANIYMVVAPDQVPRGNIPRWVLWLRLPFQGVIMAWVWWVALSHRSSAASDLERTR